MQHLNKEVEFVDLVDSSGVVCKKRIPRFKADVYPNLHLQIVICVVFDKYDRILVHKRALTKKVNPGDIDHICGGVMSGETPEIAAARESLEEAGIKPIQWRVVTKGINKYNRYRYLLAGKSDDEPGQVNASEVEWIRYIHPDELREKRNTGEFTFVDEFFEDTELAMLNRP